MSLFHKNINEKLAQHIFELEKIEALTDGWYWDSHRVYALERIDEKLIKDLLGLYKSRKTDKAKFEQVLQKLSALHIILRKFMKERKADIRDRRFVILINRFVQEIEKLLDNIPLRIGITGYVTQKFDEPQALKCLRKIFDMIEKKYPKRTKEVVGKLIDEGIYAIAYREATRRKWKTVGIQFLEFQNHRMFPVNEVVQSAEYSDFTTFMYAIDILVRVGGLYKARLECEHARRENKEVYEYNVKAELKTIADIDAIEETRNVRITTRKDIPKFVEKPLLKACLILYDKNIETFATSANAKDIGRFAYIIVHYATLSKENKRIGERYGQATRYDNMEALIIKIPIQYPEVKVSEIERKSVQIANAFKHQKMTWVVRYTWKQLLKGYGVTPEQAKRKGWTPETFSNDNKGYYDPKERLIYLSEEHYRKAKGEL